MELMDSTRPKHAICHYEVLATIHSVQGLLMLVERYQNHPETSSYLDLISRSLMRLEVQVNDSIKQIES